MSVILRTIGNSRGVLIPKALIEQAGLEGHELTFQLVEDGLLIKSGKIVRKKWKEQIAQTLQTQAHDVDKEWLESELTEDEHDEQS